MNVLLHDGAARYIKAFTLLYSSHYAVLM